MGHSPESFSGLQTEHTSAERMIQTRHNGVDRLRWHVASLTYGDFVYGDDLRLAKQLRGRPLGNYPGVYRDNDAENILGKNLPSGALARHFEGEEENGPLFAFVLGCHQKVDSRVGMAQAYATVCAEGQHALLMEGPWYMAWQTGNAPRQHEVMHQHFLNLVGAKADRRIHTSVNPFGYSNGGGQVYRSLAPKRGKGGEMTCDLQERIGDIPIRVSGCVDPVNLGFWNFGSSINYPPGGSQTHHHWHSTADWIPFDVDGERIQNAPERIVQQEYPEAGHLRVAEAALGDILDVCRSVYQK